MTKSNHKARQALLLLATVASRAKARLVKEEAKDLPVEVIAAAMERWIVVSIIGGLTGQLAIDRATWNLSDLAQRSRQLPGYDWAVLTEAAFHVVGNDSNASAMAIIHLLGDTVASEIINVGDHTGAIASFRYADLRSAESAQRLQIIGGNQWNGGSPRQL